MIYSVCSDVKVNATSYIQAVVTITDDNHYYSPLFENMNDLVHWKEETFIKTQLCKDEWEGKTCLDKPTS